ncbi:restriction endonuclease subunit S [Flagellimonas sp. S174]|uniref:restriction endonuclease subunit S n=1 Tax=Flagellimonas sp. S174 TaxID=3410790 RepID=UPI003BF4BEFD
MGNSYTFKTKILRRTAGKVNTPLNRNLNVVEWGKFKVGTLFKIENTLSFNTDELASGDEFDYVTRTSQNQGVLQKTGFVNSQNINQAGNWSLGLLQMDFFYRQNPWYAGQFVCKIIPKIEITPLAIPFFSSALNKLKPLLLSVLVRNVDKTFLNSELVLPIKKNGDIDIDYMERFVASLEREKIEKMEAYLIKSNLDDFQLNEQENQVLKNYENDQIEFTNFIYNRVFNKIKQGRRLKKDDQIAGDIPFVMAGTSNTGVVNYISNPVASFPKNSITIDIFGNTFYRNYDYGAGDDTGVYWNDKVSYSKQSMLFFSTSMKKSILGKFDFGKKLRSSQSLNFEMKVPVKNNEPDYKTMDKIISAVSKLVIKDVVLYVERKKKELNRLTENTNA